jgi:excisionase family DNA binding protein
MATRSFRPDATSDLSGAPDTWPLSAVEAARVAGVSERTIRRAIARGDLPATRHAGVYRIARDDVERYRARAIGPTSLAPAERMPEVAGPTSPLIGRENERAAIRAMLLREGARLVTLTGPGGVGKTRLALEIMREVSDLFADGACFVDLSSLRDERLVLPSIAQAIGLRETQGRALDKTLVTFLAPREILLVLDNFEQVAAAASQIAMLIRACSALHILVTSRIPLRIRDEYRFPVDPLPLPSSAREPTDILTRSESMRLFVERAKAVNPALSTSPEDLWAIAGICQRLDGLPLAIELAAAWSSILPPTDLLARLSDSLRLPDHGPRDLPHRQRTVWDTIAWSYDLLPPKAQDLFRRLAVFSGGFDVQAAIAVADEPPASVLHLLGVLVEQSLLRRAERAEEGARFSMLETVREFAWYHLEVHGLTMQVRGRHAEHYLTLAEHIESVLYGAEMRRHLDRLEIEYSNFLPALGYFIEIGDATRELRLAGMLSEYWYYRGQISEGIGAIGSALERGEDAPPGVLARAMSELGFLHWATGAPDKSLPLLVASIPLVRDSGDRYRQAQIQFMWADVLRCEAGREAEAIALLKEVADWTAEPQPPIELYPSTLADLGDLWIALGDQERGVGLLNQALSLFERSGNQLGIGVALLRLGRQDRLGGNIRKSAKHLAGALRAHREAGIVTHTGIPLAELERLVVASGRQGPATRIAGMIQAITDRTGAAFDSDWTIARPPGEADVTGRDDLATFESGRALRFDDALAEAIAIADALAEGVPLPGAIRSRPPHAPVRLSSREQHVLSLLAQRHTAPEIAEQLFLSVRTVERHVSNVYNKLGVNSRRAAVAVATHHGLV